MNISSHLIKQVGIDSDINFEKNSVVSPYEKEMTGGPFRQIAKDIVQRVIDYQSTPEAKTKKCMFLYTYFEANGIKDLSDEDKDNLKELKDLANELSNNGPCVLKTEPSLFLNIAILLRDIEFYKNLRESGSLLTSNTDTPPFENLLNCENKEFILNVVNYECEKENLAEDFATVMPAIKCIDRTEQEEIKLALAFTTAIYFKNEVNFWNTYKSTETAKEVWLKIKDSVKKHMFQTEKMLWAYMGTIDSKLSDINLFKYSANKESEFKDLHKLFHNPDFIKEILDSFSAPGGLMALDAIIKKINELGVYSIQKDNKLVISWSKILAIKDNDGKCGWYWMAYNKQIPELAKALLDRDFDKAEVLKLLTDGLAIQANNDVCGWNWMAEKNQILELAKALLDRDFDKAEVLKLLTDGLAIKDNNGWSGWHSMVNNNQMPEFIKALAELGLDKSKLITLLTNGLAIKDNDGNSAWHWIAKNKQMPEFIKALAELGLDKSELLKLLTDGLAIQDNNGKCGWYWIAYKQQMPEFIKVLAELGLDKSKLITLLTNGLAIKDNDGWSGWHLIANNNQILEFIKALGSTELGLDKKAELLELIAKGLAIQNNDGGIGWHLIVSNNQILGFIEVLLSKELGFDKAKVLELLKHGLAIKNKVGWIAWYWILSNKQMPEFIKALGGLGFDKSELLQLIPNGLYKTE